MIIRLDDAPIGNRGYVAPDDFLLEDWEVLRVSKHVLTVRNLLTTQQMQLPGRVAPPLPEPGGPDDPRLKHPLEQ